jgi:hypothetical protein
VTNEAMSARTDVGDGVQRCARRAPTVAVLDRRSRRASRRRFSQALNVNDRAHEVAFGERPQRAVRRQPGQLVARGGAKRLMACESFDEIGGGQRRLRMRRVDGAGLTLTSMTRVAPAPRETRAFTV